jgi:cobalt/nickel transport system permease protein
VHIPDGYLSPIFAGGMGVVTVPGWIIAARRVEKALNHRTVPLLAVMSALSFTIMMFNVPVPGGTTAHGTGAALLAIVLGPWAAAIGVSTALIIQTLFFGDGGVLAIFANCFNIGMLLPFVAYGAYRAIAGRSPTATRRLWAAGLGAYAGMAAAGLAVGVELGLQPLLFVDPDGRPLYSPYGLREAVPAMLVAHLFGAAIVEAIITSLGLTYLQRSHPEYLAGRGAASVGRGPARGAAAQRAAAHRSPLPAAVALSALGLAVLLGAGLVVAGGDTGRLFGTDWSSVSWPDVATMLVVVGGLAALALPLAHRLLPERLKGTGAVLVALAILVPLGLIAPGAAYGEASAEDLERAFGYVPAGLAQLAGIFSAPLPDYNLPLPFFSGEATPLWRQAIGYQVTGIVGVLAIGAVITGLAALRRWRAAPPAAPSAA